MARVFAAVKVGEHKAAIGDRQISRARDVGRPLRNTGDLKRLAEILKAFRAILEGKSPLTVGQLPSHRNASQARGCVGFYGLQAVTWTGAKEALRAPLTPQASMSADRQNRSDCGPASSPP